MRDCFGLFYAPLLLRLRSAKDYGHIAGWIILARGKLSCTSKSQTLNLKSEVPPSYPILLQRICATLLQQIVVRTPQAAKSIA